MAIVRNRSDFLIQQPIDLSELKEAFSELKEIAEYQYLQNESRSLIRKIHNPIFNLAGDFLLQQLVMQLMFFKLIPFNLNPLNYFVRDAVDEYVPEKTHLCDLMMMGKINAKELIAFADVPEKNLAGLTTDQQTAIIVQHIAKKCAAQGGSALIIFARIQTVISMLGTYKLNKIIQNQFLLRNPLGLLGITSKYYARNQSILIPHSSQFIPRHLITKNKKTLRQLRDDLSKKHFYLRMISRLIIFMTIMIRLFNIPASYTQAIVFFMLLPTALSSLRKDSVDVVTNLYGHCRKHSEEKQKRNRLKQYHLDLNKLSSALGQSDWQKYTDESGPKFLLNLESTQHASIKSLYLALEFVLIKHNVSLLAWCHNQFILPYSDKLDVQLIIKDCDIFIQHRNQKIILEAQLNQLKQMGLITNWSSEPIEDANKNLDYHFYLHLHQSLTANQCEMIQKLMKTDKAKTEFTLVKTNSQSFSESVLTELAQIKISQPEQNNSSVVPEAKNTKIKMAMKLPSPLPKVKSETTPVVINFGKHGVFNSNDPQCKIKEIKAFYYPRYTHFGIFSASTGDKRRDAQFEKILNKETLDAPKGKSGIVKSIIRLRDKQGRWKFFTVLKLKDPELNGRVIDGEIVQKGRVTLHNFNCYIPKAHYK